MMLDMDIDVFCMHTYKLEFYLERGNLLSCRVKG